MSIEYGYGRALIEQRRFIAKVYGWMFLALMVTALVAYYTANSEDMIYLIFGNQVVFWSLLIGEIILTFILSWAIDKLSVVAAIFSFFLFAIINGLTLSCVFLLYTETSIAMTFVITAGTFGIMSLYGYFTKRDLTSVGNICLMGLIGLIMASITNLFYYNALLDNITAYIGVLIFVGLTAYDTQIIKEYNVLGNEGTEEDHKESIQGALKLYLDFINLFLKLIKILGKAQSRNK